MASYSQVYMTFWTDSKIDDDFSPQEKYMYLYLLTNPHINICGCYSVSNNQMIRETGLDKDTVMGLLERLQNTHDVIRYSQDNKEVLLLNWYRYNWASSEKTLKGVLNAAEQIKTTSFKEYVKALASGNEAEPPVICSFVKTSDTPSGPSAYMHTPTNEQGYPLDGVSNENGYPLDGVSFAPVTVTVNDNVSVSDNDHERGIDNLQGIDISEKDRGKGGRKNSLSKSKKQNSADSNLQLLETTSATYDLSESLIAKLSDWMRYKGEKKFAYQEQGMKALLSQVVKHVADYGEGAVMDVIDLSMSNGWQGIIWDKLIKSGTRASPYQPKDTMSFLDIYQAEYGGG